MGGIGIWQLVIVLVIVVMLFGTKRLKGLGGDLGEAIKGFKTSMGNDEHKPAEPQKSCLEGDASSSRPTESKH